MTAPQTEAPGPLAGGAGREDTQQTTPILPPADADRKREATLIAKLALHGVVLHRLHGGGFLLAWPRGGLTREVDDLDAVEGVLRAMGGRR